ncbi:hypothetical protein D3C72_1499480 [compost metagenome]
MVALVKTVRVAAVGQALQLAQEANVERAARDGVIDGLAVDLRRARRVVQRLRAALDLERIDADFHQALDMLDGAQVLRIHDVGAVLVFEYRHQLARALCFFNQIGLVGQRVARLLVQGGKRIVVGLGQRLMEFQRHHLHAAQVAAGVFGRIFHLVIPAAGIRARALVRVAVVEIAGQQAAARIGDAQGAVDEDFQFHFRAALADFLDLVERQFAR